MVQACQRASDRQKGGSSLLMPICEQGERTNRDRPRLSFSCMIAWGTIALWLKKLICLELGRNVIIPLGNEWSRDFHYMFL